MENSIKDSADVLAQSSSEIFTKMSAEFFRIWFFNDKLDFTDEADGLTEQNVGSKGTGISKTVLNDRATFFNSIASLVSGKKVLDVGCNNGRWMSWLLDQNASHVVGIDSDSGVIGVANTNLQKYFAFLTYWQAQYHY